MPRNEHESPARPAAPGRERGAAWGLALAAGLAVALFACSPAPPVPVASTVQSASTAPVASGGASSTAGQWHELELEVAAELTELGHAVAVRYDEELTRLLVTVYRTGAPITEDELELIRQRAVEVGGGIAVIVTESEEEPPVS